MNIYNLIIIDESGSMCSIEHQAVSSMNETIQTVKAVQKNHPEQKQFITLISFSGSGMEGVKVIRDRVPAEDVAEISSGDYNPNGCTPLHDAMGFGITALDKAAGKDDVVLVTIITDGMENSSNVYSRGAVSELVASQRKKGWTFAYIGANQDSAEVAREMNINNALDFRADASGATAMSHKLMRCRVRHIERAMACPEAMQDSGDFFGED